MNKKILTTVIVGVMAMALVSAALVTYWGQVQVDMEVTEAITVVGGVCTFSTVAGGDYELCLMDVTNNLGEDISADATLKVQKWTNGAYRNLVDDAGLLVGLTEDISYCWTSEGDMTSVDTDCKTDYEAWMNDNLDWLDWGVTQPYDGEYDTNLITNNEGDSTHPIPLVNGELSVPKTIDALDSVQVALYVDSAVALEEGNYRVIIEVSP